MPRLHLLGKLPACFLLSCFLLSLALLPLAGAEKAAKADAEPWDGAPRHVIVFPVGAGQVDVVKQYGAKGDGKTDDTAALQKAISKNLGYHSRIIYLPAGTYLVSKTLWGRLADGSRMGGMKLFGEQRERTIIRLKDNCPGFQDVSKPEPVIRFLSNPPHGDESGNGNAGHFNSLVNLTIDSGSGNAGANGINWLPSNIGTLREVTIRSGDGAGVTGIDLTMAWPGPGLGRHVLVSGFQVGIRLRHHEYGMTFHGLALEKQREAGIINSGNTLHIRDLRSRNSVPAIINTMPTGHRAGQLVLLDADLSGSGPVAIDNNGIAYLRNIRSSGYAAVVRGSGAQIGETLIGASTQNIGGSPDNSLNLPTPEVPDVPWDPPSEWAIVRNAREAQAAIDAGKTTICFPYIETRFDQTVIIRKNVRRIIGMGSNLWSAGAHPTWRFEGTTAPVTVLEWMASDGVEMANPKSRTLIMRHMVGTRVTANAPECGPLFIEDVCSGPWTFTAPMDVWAYQWNPECDPVNVSAKGARLWVLGWKTERPGIQFDMEGGALELLGGLAYPCSVVPVDRPMFHFKDTSYSLFLRYASYGEGRIHPIKIRDQRGAQIIDIPEIERGLVTGFTPADRTRVQEAMRGEVVAKKENRSSVPPAVSARAAWKKPDAAALVPWDERLRGRVREELAARREPRFVLSSVHSEVTIQECDAKGDLQIGMGGGGISWQWDRLGLDDRARLAVALLRPFNRDDTALAAFYLISSGEISAGVAQLAQSGDAGDAVRAALQVGSATTVVGPSEVDPAVAP